MVVAFSAEVADLVEEPLAAKERLRDEVEVEVSLMVTEYHLTHLVVLGIV